MFECKVDNAGCLNELEILVPEAGLLDMDK